MKNKNIKDKTNNEYLNFGEWSIYKYFLIFFICFIIVVGIFAEKEKSDSVKTINTSEEKDKFWKDIGKALDLEQENKNNLAYSSDYIKEGIRLYSLKSYKESLDIINKGITIYEENLLLYFLKGRVLYRLGKYEEAVESFDFVIEKDGGYIYNRIVAGNRDLSTKDWASLYYNKGLSLYKLGKYKEAKTSLIELFKLDSKHELGGKLITKINTYLNVNDNEKIDNSYELNEEDIGKKEVTSIVSNNNQNRLVQDYIDDVNYELATSQNSIIGISKEEGSNNALKIVDEGLIIYNDNPELNFLKAEIFRLRLGNNKDAVDLYNKAISLNNSKANYYSSLGSSLLELGDISNAKVAFRNALKIDPSDLISSSLLKTLE